VQTASSGKFEPIPAKTFANFEFSLPFGFVSDPARASGQVFDIQFTPDAGQVIPANLVADQAKSYNNQTAYGLER
jgi:hypothetical protein